MRFFTKEKIVDRQGLNITPAAKKNHSNPHTKKVHTQEKRREEKNRIPCMLIPSIGVSFLPAGESVFNKAVVIETLEAKYFAFG